jgi:putative Ca2+/H+ antiporter (TMEM165/GDT1 family)
MDSAKGIANSTVLADVNLPSFAPVAHPLSPQLRTGLTGTGSAKAIDAALSALAGPQQASSASFQEYPFKTPLFLGSLVPGTFLRGFLLSLSMIIVGELGDRTFIISALMSMKHPRSVVFWASFGALAVMTGLSVAFGILLPSLVEPKWTRVAAGMLFLVFGAKAMYDGWRMPKGSDSVAHSREYSEVAQEVGAVDEEEKCDADLERGQLGCTPTHSHSHAYTHTHAHTHARTPTGTTSSSVFLQIFSLVFFAEWGDRSQLAVIALAASEVTW